MKQLSRQEIIRRQTLEALDRAGRSQAEVDRRRGEPPQPGEVFALAESAEYEVQWVVIDQDARNPSSLLLVPLDLRPLAGRADVAVTADPNRSAWTLRCRYTVWIEADRLDVDRRVAILDAGIIDEARRRIIEIEEARLSSSARLRSIEAEPEYADVEDRLRRAHHRVAQVAKSSYEEVEAVHEDLEDSHDKLPPES